MSGRGGFWFAWAVALLVAAVFASLGVWQLGRGKQKDAMLAASHQVLAERKPLPLAAAADPARTGSYDWATGSGRFLDAPAVLLDNQTRDSRPGIRAYRVFQPDSDAAPLLVELGWLPLPGNRQMPDIDAIAEPTQLAGLLVAPPSAGIVRGVPVAQADGNLLVIGVEPAVIAAQLRLPTLAPRVLKLDPASPLGYARDLDILPNTLPPERHLGYAVQWFGLALTVLITALLLTWRRQRRR